MFFKQHENEKIDFILICKRQKLNFPALFQRKHEVEERGTKNIAYAVMDWTEKAVEDIGNKVIWVSWETREMENLETKHSSVNKRIKFLF